MAFINTMIPEKIVAITPSDSTDLTGIRAIRVGTTAGNVALVNGDGTTVVVTGVQVGETLMTGKISRVNSTSTTAVGIVGYYMK